MSEGLFFLDQEDIHRAAEVRTEAVRGGHGILWQMWHDGGRPLMVAFVIFLASMVLFFGAFFLYLLRPGPSAGLCEYPSPRKILSNVRGVEGPAIRENGALIERRETCVQGTGSLEVLAFRDFCRLDETTNCTQLVRDLRGQKQARIKGSSTSDIPVQLPPEVTAGTWRLQGLDQVPKTGELRTWFSEPFLVVPEVP